MRLDDLVQKGIRLKKIREMADLTSQELANKTGFSRQSVSYWENGSQNGLSFKGAQASIRIVKEHHIICEFDWLWDGIGEEPYSLLDQQVTETNNDPFTRPYPMDIRADEMKLFESIQENSILTMVKDQGMRPLYQKEDWVGGYWRALTPKLIGHPCIVEIGGDLQVRIIKKGSKNGYHFSFLTYSEEINEPFELADQAPTRVAPVIRLWRKK
jgi:transcriptional regulator with XRE-family HTH domain